MYIIARLIITAVVIALASVICFSLLKKGRKIIACILSMIFLSGTCALWILPVENCLLRFNQAADSFQYVHMFTQEKIVVPYDNGAVIIYYENDSSYIDIVEMDNRGYKAYSPFVRHLDSLKFDMDGFVLISKRLPQSEVYFVCIVYTVFDDPKLNKDKFFVDTITDIYNNQFSVFDYSVSKGFKQKGFYAFTMLDIHNYELYINRKEYSLK